MCFILAVGLVFLGFFFFFLNHSLSPEVLWLCFSVGVILVWCYFFILCFQDIIKNKFIKLIEISFGLENLHYHITKSR